MSLPAATTPVLGMWSTFSAIPTAVMISVGSDRVGVAVFVDELVEQGVLAGYEGCTVGDGRIVTAPAGGDECRQRLRPVWISPRRSCRATTAAGDWRRQPRRFEPPRRWPTQAIASGIVATDQHSGADADHRSATACRSRRHGGGARRPAHRVPAPPYGRTTVPPEHLVVVPANHRLISTGPRGGPAAGEAPRWH